MLNLNFSENEQFDITSPPGRPAIVHGVFVSVLGCGVLIIGEPRTGKSECALELISKGHKLIADDVVEVEKSGGRLFGKAPDRFAGLLEVRGLGIINVRELFGEKSFVSEHGIDLCIEVLEKLTQSMRIGNSTTEFSFFDVKVPRFALSPNRNLPLLIETAVKLIGSGNNAEAELIEAHNRAVAAKA